MQRCVALPPERTSYTKPKMKKMADMEGVPNAQTELALTISYAPKNSRAIPLSVELQDECFKGWISALLTAIGYVYQLSGVQSGLFDA